MVSSICPRETGSQDEASPGPVDNGELICRGAYLPDHIRADDRIRMGVLPISHLQKAQLSVYRSGGPYALEYAIALQQLRKVEAQGTKENPRVLAAVLRATACAIRGIHYSGAEVPIRCFFIVDECECDQNGNKHPSHAHIGFCCELKKLDEDDEDKMFMTWAQEQLKLTMEQQIDTAC